MFEKEITFDRFIRGLMTVAGIGLLIFVINLLSPVLLPFFIAWLLAYMIYPTVKFFQYKLHFKNRILCIAISLLLIVSCLIGFFYLVIPPVVGEFMKLRVLVAGFIRETGDSAITRNLELFFQEYIDQNSILQLLQKNNIMEALQVAINQLWALVSQTSSTLWIPTW